MPRGFSDHEKEVIRAQLLEQGRRFLTISGLKKTSVEELAHAAGISKGAFYLFFPSKEELFFTIFEHWEADYQAELLRKAGGLAGSPRERLEAFFQHAFSAWRTSPLFQHFGQGEFAYLARKLPPERLQAHQADDDRFAEELLGVWRATGIVVPFSPQEFTGLMRALFFVSLHADDIGAMYPSTITLLINLLADHIAEASAQQTGDNYVTGQ